MVTKEEAKIRVATLVEDFSKISKEELDGRSEFQIQAEFIDPLFEALGWDMRKDAQREKKIFGKRADYILSIGNRESVVIEAKKTSVTFVDEKEGEQAVSYAYHKKIKFAVLTNFKYVRVYHALSHTRRIERNLLKDEHGPFWINFKDFEKEFDRLWLLSKESFEKEEIHKLLKNIDKRTIKQIDESILGDLLEFRGWLSKDLKGKRTSLKDEQIDEIVQILLDRLIFMRAVEDRGLELEDFLLKIVDEAKKGFTDMNLWAVLKSQFLRFDRTYNSKLFSDGILEKEGFFDQEVLVKVITGLYYGTEDNQARYRFNQIPGDLLGSIYEQYLGTILQGTEKRVKLDSESGKRKKMGIYYTPAYIVDYIVKNTVGEYIKDKSIDEILEVNIVDPACGSGSFLIRAFQEVCDVVERKLNDGEEGSKILFKKQKVERLNLGQKIEILKNCIYGVDLDEKAVELAQLNLLLKVLEGETKDTIANLKKPLLPNLKDGIKNGNSLINDQSVAGDKAFNWKANFSEEFSLGGFDIVIGNPPYVDYSKISGSEWINENYESAKVNGKVVKYNLFQLFIEKAIKIMKKGGVFGYINPNTYLSADNAFSLRKLILEETDIKQIIDVSKLPIFKEASTYPVITILNKRKEKGSKLDTIQIINENQFGHNFHFKQVLQKNFEEDIKLNFVLGGNDKSKEIFDNLAKKDQLKDLKEFFVWGSSITGFAKHKGEKGIKYAPLIQTRDIKRYSIQWDGDYIERSIYSNKLTQLFKQRKIVIARVTKGIQATIDEGGYFVGKSSILIPKDKNIFEVLLAIINSKLINYYYRSKFETTHMAGGYIRFDIPYLQSIPISLPEKPQEKKITSLVNQMLSFQKKLHEDKPTGNEREGWERQIKNIDYEIDQEVYKLYGITEDEQKIIEESLK